jgi:predicted nucleotidyltransferase
MAHGNDDVIKIARHFLDEIRKTYKVELAFLYGSYAKGVSNKWSDIDIAYSDASRPPIPIESGH